MIKDILDALPAPERRRLVLAHEQGLAQQVEYAEGKFVGVNLQGVPNLRVTERAGAWTTGNIVRSKS